MEVKLARPACRGTATQRRNCPDRNLQEGVASLKRRDGRRRRGGVFALANGSKYRSRSAAASRLMGVKARVYHRTATRHLRFLLRHCLPNIFPNDNLLSCPYLPSIYSRRHAFGTLPRAGGAELSGRGLRWHSDSAPHRAVTLASSRPAIHELIEALAAGLSAYGAATGSAVSSRLQVTAALNSARGGPAAGSMSAVNPSAPPNSSNKHCTPCWSILPSSRAGPAAWNSASFRQTSVEKNPAINPAPASGSLTLAIIGAARSTPAKTSRTHPEDSALSGPVACKIAVRKNLSSVSSSMQPMRDAASSSVAKSGAVRNEMSRSGSVFSKIHATSVLDTSDKKADGSVRLRGESTSSVGAGFGVGVAAGADAVGSGDCVEPEHASNSARRERAAQDRSFNMEAPLAFDIRRRWRDRELLGVLEHRSLGFGKVRLTPVVLNELRCEVVSADSTQGPCVSNRSIAAIRGDGGHRGNHLPLGRS